MTRGFYAAASGLIAQQAKLDLVANNTANTSTTGFKPQQAGFSALLYREINGGDASTITVGHGVKLQSTGLDFRQGELIATGSPLDFAIEGHGFFGLQDAGTNEITYSRCGSFHLSEDGKGLQLVDAAGRYVLDGSGKRVTVGEDFTGSQIGLFAIPNPYGLALRGGNQFAITDGSGKATAMKDGTLRAGFLEASRVSTAEEMVRMIEASKGFALGSRVVQLADEMERTVNQLR